MEIFIWKRTAIPTASAREFVLHYTTRERADAIFSNILYENDQLTVGHDVGGRMYLVERIRVTK